MRFLRTLLKVWLALALMVGAGTVSPAAASGPECAQAVAGADCRCIDGTPTCVQVCAVCHVFGIAVVPFAGAGSERHAVVTVQLSPWTSLAQSPETGPPRRSC
jgi:hypothetical protein